MSDEYDEQEFQQIIRRERRITLILNSNKPDGSPKSSSIFEAGDKICGQVNLVLSGGAPTCKVKLALVCLTQVRLALQPKRKSIVETLFSPEEGETKECQIFFDRQNIVQIDLLSAEQQLTCGKHELPFSFNLPRTGLSSTLNSFYGFIKYTVEIFTFDEDFNESRGEKEIVILAPSDEKLEVPISRTAQKSLQPMDNGMVTVSGVLENKGYYPGGTIPVKLNITNKSNLKMHAQVSLYQIQIFECNQVHRILETCLTHDPVVSQLVDANQSISDTVTLPLSNKLVLSLKNPLITVKYYVYVTLDIPQMLDLHLKLPFIMTTKQACNTKLLHSKGSIKSSSLSKPKHDGH